MYKKLVEFLWGEDEIELLMKICNEGLIPEVFSRDK